MNHVASSPAPTAGGASQPPAGRSTSPATEPPTPLPGSVADEPTGHLPECVADETPPQDTVVNLGGDLHATRGGGKCCLVKIYPPGKSGMIDVPRRRFVIGRGKACDVDLADTAVSRRHACLEPDGTEFVLLDMASTNGTFVNDERIHRHRLAAGDFVRIGSHILKYLASDSIEVQYFDTIYSMMIHDGLTGVHNKRYFVESLERELVRSNRHRRPLSLLMLDIDHFKQVNDTHGHLAGDEVLRELAHRLETTVRQDEVLARYGGEEFAVILPESDLDASCSLGERLRELVADAPVQVNDLSIAVTVSLGIATTNGDRQASIEEIVSAADAKLYEAKRSGRNRVAW